MKLRQPLMQVKTVPIPLGSTYKMRVKKSKLSFNEGFFL
ncbi:hypothetical protein SAMN05216584_11167 [Selenomonas sp. WCT3]|nr:hypothetical protein SAMN05216584_11167 [Selenomonas ruminantium]